MERLASLINSLKTGFEEGRSVTELLSLTDELRTELTRSGPAAEPTKSEVSVWLPAGYQPPSQKPYGVAIEPNIPQPVVEKVQPSPFISTTIRESFQMHATPEVASEVEQTNHQPRPLIVPNGVPRPPQVAFLEEADEEKEVEETQEQHGAGLPEDDFLLPGNFHVQPSGIFRETMQGNAKLFQEEHAEDKPIVVELELPEETDHLVSDDLRHQNMTITENFLKGAGNTVAEARPLELHEILANRVVAQPANIEMPKQARVLADTLSGGKIADLRKAISINDRFRFIKSLFRGDDSLFERSVKTINNFNILQEAQYWMQRELVIKLGWNEEDELVQMFYQLVSRRFL